MRSRWCLCVCVCLCIPLIVARQRIGKHPRIVARQRLDKSPPIVAKQRLGRNLPIVARQWLGRNVTAVTNTHATIKELLDASFSALVGSPYIASERTAQKTPLTAVFLLRVHILCQGDVFTEPLPSKGRLLWFGYLFCRVYIAVT
jgi:hypothetical protein